MKTTEGFIMYYATVRYEDVNDLFRFETKTERDEFVSERDYACEIKAAEAKLEYKEQFRFWAGAK